MFLELLKVLAKNGIKNKTKNFIVMWSCEGKFDALSCVFAV